MFAVVILGIGFIMVAAVFPVAIRQNELSAASTASVQASSMAADAFRRGLADVQVPSARVISRSSNNEFQKVNGSGTAVALTAAPTWTRSSPTQWIALSESVDPTVAAQAASQWRAYSSAQIQGVDRRVGVAGAIQTAVATSITWTRVENESDTIRYYSLLEAMQGWGLEGFLSNYVAVPVVITGTSPNEVRTYVETATLTIGVTSSAKAILVVGRSPVPEGYTMDDVRFPLDASASAQQAVANQFFGSANGALIGAETPATLQLKRLRAGFIQRQGSDAVRLYNYTYPGAVTRTVDRTVSGPGGLLVIAKADTGTGGRVRVLADSEDTANDAANGRTVRLGRELATGSDGNGPFVEFELVAGQDVTTIWTTTRLEAPPFSTNAANAPANLVEVLTLGRRLQNPRLPFQGNPSQTDYNPYVGPVQDVTSFGTMIGFRQ